MFNLFKRKPVENAMAIDIKSPTVPGAFGVNEATFGLLVDDLVNCINPENRMGSFDNYLKSPMFKGRGLSLRDPRQALIVGFAFSTAILMQRELQQKIAANKVLEAFYPEVKSNKTLHD